MEKFIETFSEILYCSNNNGCDKHNVNENKYQIHETGNIGQTSPLEVQNKNSSSPQ